MGLWLKHVKYRPKRKLRKKTMTKTRESDFCSFKKLIFNLFTRILVRLFLPIKLFIDLLLYKKYFW